jgi:uncharacterized RDD family membrane protein YckC
MTIYASRRRRVAAALIDGLVTAPVAVLAFLLFLYLPTLFVGLGFYLALVPSGYSVVCSVRSGQTLGMRALGLKVTHTKGSLLSYRAAGIREVLNLGTSIHLWLLGVYVLGLTKRANLEAGSLEAIFALAAKHPSLALDRLEDALYWLTLLSLACSFFNDKKRCLHDFLANAQVIREDDASQSASTH